MIQSLSDCGLHDVESSGYKFTCSNMRLIPNNIQEQLDYPLINDSWATLWPLVEIFHLPRFHSDHTSIVVSCGFRRADRGRKRTHMFRFEEVWLEIGEECAEIVAETWHSGSTDIDTKIIELGKALSS